MGKAIIVTGLALLLSASSAGAADSNRLKSGSWVFLRPPLSFSFSVSMPAPPQKSEKRDEWRAEDSDGRVYSAAQGYYTEPQKIVNPDGFMRMMANRLAANTGSKIAYFWTFKYQYVPACEFKLVDLQNHRVGVGRYFLVNQWFYFLDVTSFDRDFDPKPAKKFFESFRIINPQLKDFQP